jgi:clan AA aspartic protease
MGLTFAEIELVNSDDLGAVKRGFIQASEVRQVKVSALVDSGAIMMSIPQSISQQLGLRILGDSDVELGDGSVVQLDIAGPLEVRFQNRRTTVEVLVTPQETEVLLGSISMGPRM